ncbi:MAG: hypothetical protein IJT73_08520 [Selenomonadaceae bacterium]|nr:hypothetical protein [Selenomonadaceae bacterium]
MKKFLVAAAIALSIFNFTETEAATIGADNAEIVEISTWTKFRDHITGRRAREKERERWERERERHRYDNHGRGRYSDGHRQPPPPPRHGRY